MIESFTTVTVRVPTTLIDFVDRVRYAERRGPNPTSRSDVIEAALWQMQHRSKKP